MVGPHRAQIQGKGEGREGEVTRDTASSSTPGLHSLCMTAYSRAMSTTQTSQTSQTSQTTRTERLAQARAARSARTNRRRQARRRHLRQALTALALAAAVLTGLQLYAAQGISQARQAASSTASTASSSSSSSSSDASRPAMSGQTSLWVTEDTRAPYSKDDAAATPLDLPRCTTAPDTSVPCLAHLHTSPSGAPDRVVVLEEDGSMTALVPR